MVAVRAIVDELALRRALRRLDLIDPEAIVTWAEGWMLSDDEQVPEVTALATISDVRGEDVDMLIENLAATMGLPLLTEKSAGVIAAQDAARALRSGEMTPIDAARRIWRIARLAPAAEPLLRNFIGLASQWDDDPAHRTSYEEEIRSEALHLAGWA